ncbi:MAG: thiamine/thiamine pyrophosphate ABC transporter permease ThiP [Hoeflea sp.]|uniref:thiamine/thiamine pyrophosphate ABC transporter permease ThiP n=1 Tax=Hoeflea sp. TaxID=1940281 RepID=UPI001D345BE8|nr:thiamine/thiamine pyrophosphate ABC transporter permease ThiP [Hoeflea sp.]MBU4528575.1 thiamine/thiamine pyrophosphate ABC transporter permease ThiP [Alphaproteobacteria bacterium]MBU4545620.1 thiamine/thiamine pyrophosphate ABC transporter permease ThiP [Alphaproteobacteria bacterium]MBU4552230.1 thiamine/thiamine pyrophosphate ABC transporter permease ThiP [Alphaproteobacteria bacterium]MBV1726178.1 thiamine/thiamine pyrophosphate ABC transporter permease ThiP [Hoeflea sp.]MBV1762395.1 t
MLTRTEHHASRAGGVAALMFIGLALAAPVAVLVAQGTGSDVSASQGAYLARITWFTLLQAGLSTLLSVGFAVPLARSLARRPSFWGRRWLINLFAVPLGLPPLVAALGLLEVWGRNGVANQGLALFGVETPFSIYGLSGILIAHVFFNMPLAARLILPGLERLPPEYWKTAANLGMSGFNLFRFVEWPAMRRSVGAAAGLVFMLCATSFTLVLVLGGGPAATTLEVAIYQALRFDFDPGRAVLLSAIQIGLTLAVMLGLKLISVPTEAGDTKGGGTDRPDVARGWHALPDAALIGAAGVFVGAPLVAVVISGLAADLMRLLTDALFWRAAATSLLIGIAAAIVSVSLASLMVRARYSAGDQPQSRRLGLLSGMSGAAGSLTLLVPPVVLGAGWFLMLGGGAGQLLAPLAVIVLINALMALPFVMRVIEPAHQSAMERNGRLALSLGITGINRIRQIDIPAMLVPLATGFVFAVALSLGDLGAIALFGSDRIVTLPWLLYQKLGSYRTADAAGLALLLGVTTMALMIIADRLGNRSGSALWPGKQLQ